RERLRVVLCAEDFAQAPIGLPLRDGGQSVEGRRIDLVAQRIAHQSAVEIELAQGASRVVRGPAPLELLAKGRAACDRAFEPRRADEEHRLDERLDELGDDGLGASGAAALDRGPYLVMHPRDLVLHVDLMLHYEE